MTHLRQVRETLKPDVQLVAVSKFHPAALIREAYGEGQRVFGESRVQELQAKHAVLPADIEWHFIGHLQANKVKYIAPYISLIHAVDSLRLLAEIDRQAAKHGRVIPCLLELHLAQEDTKYGLTLHQCTELLQGGEWRKMTHARITGLMCMASYTDDLVQVRQEFRTARDYFNEVRARFFADAPDFTRRSWGMSHDYHVAMEEGANLVRVGTAIFGEREY